VVNQEQIKALRALVIAKAKAYATGTASYDGTCFTAADARVHVGADSEVRVYGALQDLEAEGLVEWHRPAAIPGYWRATAKAAREVLS
jgi:hypothetical protein